MPSAYLVALRLGAVIWGGVPGAIVRDVFIHRGVPPGRRTLIFPGAGVPGPGWVIAGGTPRPSEVLTAGDPRYSIRECGVFLGSSAPRFAGRAQVLGRWWHGPVGWLGSCLAVAAGLPPGRMASTRIAEGCISRKVRPCTCIAADEGIVSRTFGPDWMAGRLR